jgi:hypothetical protein
MTTPLPRALIFAVLALIAWAILSTVVSLIAVGLPQPGESVPAFQERVQGPAGQIDLIVGAVVMLTFGWLAARPFSGQTTIRTALLLAVFYIVIEFAATYLLTGARSIDVVQSALAYGVKAAAALVGGWLASRRSGAGASLEEA